MAQLVVALDENGWSADQVQEDVSEILFDCEATISVTDVGIGPYEFWGSRGCDSRLEVDEVTGDDVVVPVEIRTFSACTATQNQVCDLPCRWRCKRYRMRTRPAGSV